MTVFEVEFMQRALLAAFLVGLSAPAIGIYLVQRRLSLMGDGIGHVAFTGVAAGFLTGTSPLVTALIVAAVGAVVIELLRERGRTPSDVALALIFYGGIAGGLLLTKIADASTANLFGYLFGSVLSVDATDLVIIGALAAFILVLSFLFRNELFAISYDEEVARVAGIKVRVFNIGVAIATAVTVAVTMRVVGILLVSALLVLPVAAVQQVTRSFRSTLAASLVLGASVSVAGLLLAYYTDVYPAATIVLTGITCFAIAATYATLRRPA